MGASVMEIKNIFEMNSDELREYNESKLLEFKELFLTTDMPVDDIYETIGVTKNDPTFRYINGNRMKHGLSAKNREVSFNISDGDYDDYKSTYQDFKKVWEANPNISKNKAFEEIGITPTNALRKYIKERMAEDGLEEHYKRGRPPKKKEPKFKNTVDPSEYESKYQEYKHLFENTDMLVKDIYTELGIAQNGSYCGRYISQRAKEDGLNAHARKLKIKSENNKINFEIHEQSSEERTAELEDFYQEFKKLWLSDSSISKKEAYKRLGKNQTKERVQYVNERMEEDSLPVHYICGGGGEKYPFPEDKEKIYQEYKKLFQTTTIPLKEIREQLDIPHNTNRPLRKYIIDRSKEDGLDGRKRNIKQQRKKNSRVKKTKPKKKKPKKSKTEEQKPAKKYAYKIDKQSIYSEKAHQIVENSRPLLEKMYGERNIKKSTQKGYEASFIRWCEYTKDRFNNLQEMIDFYLAEEDKRIPMRDRTFKKDLLGFREYLLHDKDCAGVKSDRSFKTYFAKIRTIFNHFELEMPQLPQMKIEKGYVSSYNDLPTHHMIKTACEQSPLDLKAIILFMSSSGSAKAETLSITVEMFLEGCNEYLEEPATAKNIDETLTALSNRHDIVPMIYLRRIKTDKWYHTYCSPEASYMIVESLKTRKNLSWNDKLFDYTPSLLLAKFQEINDNNNWGYVGSYRRFRSHALRKFMASNIGLSRDITDSIQGRSKDMIQEAYFKQNPQDLKKTYMEAMHKIMVYENWGHGTTLDEIERQKKRLFNDFKDDEKIIDLSVIPETPEEIKTSVGLETDYETTGSIDRSTKHKPNKANTMPITPPVQLPVGHVEGISVSQELLNYAELMEKGLLSIAEFNRVKQKLLMSVLR